MNAKVKTVRLSNGQEISIEYGRLARQADGAVVVRCGDTMMLATVVSPKKINLELDFLPLTVDYVEKYASSGKIPGGFFKREGRLGEAEILVSRLVDRALRPLFPDDFHGEVQVMIQLFSHDRENQSDHLACFAASCAIMTSDIPFPDPVSELRVVRKDGKFIINPKVEEMDGVDLELMVGGTDDSINMVEGEMDEVSEEVMLEALKAAHEDIKILNQCQREIREELGLQTREYDKLEINEDVKRRVWEIGEEPIRKMAYGNLPKTERGDILSDTKKLIQETLTEEFGENEEIELLDTQINILYKKLQKEVVRGMIVSDKKRLDDRKSTDVRAIWSEAGYLPRTHGSAIFTRGETQSLCTVTLGTKMDEQTIDSATTEGSKRFMLHYNFPAFSTGEARFLRGPGRREIGHGNLAERSLKGMIPEDYDYTVRIISDILESNGSSSMASVCGGCLALMDAGVPMKGVVSGIAMGLIMQEDGQYAILSDILGDEDFLGDMDFKVAGTEKGLTACQMDIKARALTWEIISDALAQSREGRLHIMNEMKKTLSESRSNLSPYAPRIFRMDIPQDMIGAVIGPGGKIIQEIQKTTGTTIILEDKDDRGEVTISSVDEEGMRSAEDMIKQIIAMPEVGQVYKAKVKSIKDFGAFVEFMPGKEGLLHISEIAYERIPTMEGVFEIGDEFDIKLIGIDEKTGKFRLSKKALMPKPEGYEERRGGGGGGGNRNRKQGKPPHRKDRNNPRNN